MNIPLKCISCKWFCEKEKHNWLNLPDRCFIYYIFNSIKEAFNNCNGISYNLKHENN